MGMLEPLVWPVVRLKFLPIHIFGIFGIFVLLSHTQVVAAFFYCGGVFPFCGKKFAPSTLAKDFFEKKP
jgi:hypothetical protein